MVLYRKKMFTVIYQWKVKTGSEEKFKQAWSEVTDEIKNHHGGLGSRLHQRKDGDFVAYAQWPDEETWAKPKEFDCEESIQIMQDSIEKRFDPVPLQVLVDKLVHLPAAKS